MRLVREAPGRGVKVFIVGAGAAAHLAGVVAAHTTAAGHWRSDRFVGAEGIDALLSTVQMPPGVPVATVSIGKPGATNAGVLAAQILALGDRGNCARVWSYKSSWPRKSSRRRRVWPRSSAQRRSAELKFRRTSFRRSKVRQDVRHRTGLKRASEASEPRARSEPSKRRPRARAGESEGRSPSEKNEVRHRHFRLPRQPGRLAAHRRELRARGGVAVASAEAELVVVNTCSVTASADQGARQTIRRIARDNPAAQIVVTGCYATRRPDEVAALPNVVRVVSNDDKDWLVAINRRRVRRRRRAVRRPIEPGVAGPHRVHAAGADGLRGAMQLLHHPDDPRRRAEPAD